MSETLTHNPPAWRRYLCYLTVALMPVSVNWGRMQNPPQKPFYISPLDALLPVLFLLMLVDLLQKKSWVRLKAPPLAGVLWALIALLSILWVQNTPAAEFLKNWYKTPIFFGVMAVWAFENCAGTAAEFRRLALILGGSFSLCLLLALKQYFGPVGIPFDPAKPTQDLQGTTNIRLGGWYEYRGILGAQTALLAPAAAAFALFDRKLPVRIGAMLVCGVALCVTLAAGGFVAACTGVLAVCAAYAICQPDWLRGLAGVGCLIVTVAVIVPHLPRKNSEVLLNGLVLYAPVSKDENKPTARLRRYQASLDSLTSPSNSNDPNSPPHWLKGVGLGRYQASLLYQDPYNKPGRRTDDEAAFDMDADEPFTFGFFETIFVELGIVGLLSAGFLFLTWTIAALGAFVKAGKSTELQVLALAAFGAGVGAAVLSVFGNPVIRGVGGSFAFFFALALWTWKAANEEAAP